METLLKLIEGNLYISGEASYDFFLRLLINIISTFVLIRYIYYPKNSRVSYLFTFFLMGMMIFLIASILDQVKLDMGFALGLFAIFGIVRFRSPSIDLKEMTYLFLIIGVSIINALVEFNVAEWIGLFVANTIIIASTAIMENYKPRNHIMKRMMVISPTDYTVLNNNKRLLQEVKELTGIDILKIDIIKINKVKNEISVWIYFDGHNEKNILPQKEGQKIPEEGDSDWVSNYSNDY